MLKSTTMCSREVGTEVEPITWDYGTVIESPADPTREGCTFNGWDQDIP